MFIIRYKIYVYIFQICYSTLCNFVSYLSFLFFKYNKSSYL